MTDWMLGPINEQLGCKADGVLVVCTHWETMEGHFTLPTVGELSQIHKQSTAPGLRTPRSKFCSGTQCHFLELWPSPL